MNQICEMRYSTGETESNEESQESCNYSEEEAQHYCTTKYISVDNATDEKLKSHKGRMIKNFELQQEVESQKQNKEKKKISNALQIEESK